MKTYLHDVPEELAPGEGGDRVSGRQWHWRGKHHFNAAGTFCCRYKSRRTAREKAKLRQHAPIHRDGLASEDPRRDPYERKGEVGKACPQCGRLVTSILSYTEWLHYQEWRDRNPSYGGPRNNYRPWFEPGVHAKPPGRPSWAGKHVGEGATFQCLYYTVLRPALRIAPEKGGCQRCGRLRSEGRGGTKESA